MVTNSLSDAGAERMCVEDDGEEKGKDAKKVRPRDSSPEMMGSE